MAEGNRKDPRARVLNMTVRYKSATVDEFIENHSHDISKGGIFIKTRSPFPAGTLLKFEVRIAEDQKLMQGVGRVVWRREPDRAEENFPAGMGIKFIKTAEGSAELISQIVAARQGVESSFDAGVRESGLTISGPPAESVSALATPNMKDSGKQTSLGLGPTDSERTPALLVESGPRSWPIDAETTVSSPPKKRPNLAPEKRKVVLQGPALEGPPSQPKPVPASPTVPTEERAPSRTHSRQALAEETTARRIRTSTAPRATSPSVYGLVAILGAIALGVVLLNRSRSETPEEEGLPPATAAAPDPAPPVVRAEPAPPVVPAEPTPPEPAAEATPPEPAPVEAAPVEAAVEPASPPTAAVPSAPAKPAPAAASPVPAAKPPSPPAAAAPAPRPAAPARPKPVPPEPRPEGIAIIKPSEEPAPAPPSAAPPAAAAPAEQKPPEKKKTTAAGGAPPQQAAPAPTAPSPAPAAPATPPPPASDDNPY